MNEKNYLLKWLFIFIVFLASTAILVPENDDAISSLIRQLADDLDLTEEQTIKIKSIISAARARQQMADSHIKDFLNPEQEQKFYVFKLRF